MKINETLTHMLVYLTGNVCLTIYLTQTLHCFTFSMFKTIFFQTGSNYLLNWLPSYQ